MSTHDEGDLSPGELVGEYRIERRVAAGGMGTVYAASHPVIGKRAAVKVLRRSLCTNPTVVQRFVDEARAVNQIGHRNIVDVFAFGALRDGRSYFVMEWLEGETLADRLDRGGLDLSDAFALLEQLSDALEIVHENAIVHRDLKPANLFLVPTRLGHFEVKLLDFGVAKLDSGSKTPAPPRTPMPIQRRPLTGPSMFLGTLEYAAPEQISGEPVDEKADIYSLGVIAYALFTGRSPFFHENPATLIAKVVGEEPESPRIFWPEIPPALEEMILGMLAKRPAPRPGLTELRVLLGELKTAARLMALDDVAAVVTRRASVPRKRPLLLRSYKDVSGLLHPVLHDLADGVAWITGQQTPPESGTPITVRYAVERLALHLDFGAVVETRLGGDAGKTLIRYDRIGRERLEGLFAVASEVTLRPEDLEARGVTSWKMGRDVQRTSSWSRGGVPWETEPAEVTLVAAEPARRARPAPVPAPAPASIRDVGVVSGPAAPRLSPWRGLGAKMLVISLLLTVTSGIAITVIALERVRSDRTFYFQDLNLRTSRLIAEGMGQSLDGWREDLEAYALRPEAAPTRFPEAWRCEGQRCAPLPARPADREAIGGILGAVRPGALSVFPQGDRLFIAAAASGATVVAALPSQRLLASAALFPDLTVLVADEALHRIASVGPLAPVERPADADAQLRALSGLLGVAAEKSGAREYAGPDGQRMLVGFAKTHGLVALVIVPLQVTTEAVAVLARQISWVAFLVLGVAALIALVFSRTVTRHLRELTVLAQRVARGEFNVKVKVTGKDEVAQLSWAFDAMARALEMRDREVLRIQREISEDETKSLHEELSTWLKTDLAVKLKAMREIVEQPLSREDALHDLKKRRGHLKELAKLATTSLERALSYAAIANKRVDIGRCVLFAVELARRARAPDVVIDLELSNALLLPRIEARESDVRELIQLTIEGVAELASRGTRVQVRLLREDADLRLFLHFKSGADPSTVDARLGPLQELAGADAEWVLHREQAPRMTVALAFSIHAEEVEP